MKKESRKNENTRKKLKKNEKKNEQWTNKKKKMKKHKPFRFSIRMAFKILQDVILLTTNDYKIRSERP